MPSVAAKQALTSTAYLRTISCACWIDSACSRLVACIDRNILSNRKQSRNPRAKLLFTAPVAAAVPRQWDGFRSNDLVSMLLLAEAHVDIIDARLQRYARDGRQSSDGRSARLSRQCARAVAVGRWRLAPAVRLTHRA
jgi:hypothetical protein